MLVRNRAELDDILEESMQRMVEGGAIGSCIMSMSYVFRDEDNNIMGGW